MSDRRESDSGAAEGTVHRTVGTVHGTVGTVHGTVGRETARAMGQWAGECNCHAAPKQIGLIDCDQVLFFSKCEERPR
jgi:hypothetical protein